jgi:hypothetical protein
MHQEFTVKTAKELGIPMPNPSIKPLIVAGGIMMIVTGMLFMHVDNKLVPWGIIVTGSLVFTLGLYAWLLTPLEDEHH